MLQENRNTSLQFFCLNLYMIPMWMLYGEKVFNKLRTDSFIKSDYEMDKYNFFQKNCIYSEDIFKNTLL